MGGLVIDLRLKIAVGLIITWILIRLFGIQELIFGM